MQECDYCKYHVKVRVHAELGILQCNKVFNVKKNQNISLIYCRFRLLLIMQSCVCQIPMFYQLSQSCLSLKNRVES